MQGLGQFRRGTYELLVGMREYDLLRRRKKEGHLVRSGCFGLFLLIFVHGANRQAYAMVHHGGPQAHHPPTGGSKDEQGGGHGPEQCCGDCKDRLVEQIFLDLPRAAFEMAQSLQEPSLFISRYIPVELHQKVFLQPRTPL